MPPALPVLVLHPPVAGPAAPPWAAARLAGLLEGAGARVGVHDAALDYVLNHVLDPARVRERASLLAGRRRDGSLPARLGAPWPGVRDPGGAGDLERLADRVRGVAGVLRSGAFHDPERCALAVGDLHRALALALVSDGVELPRQGRVPASPDPFAELWAEDLAPRLERLGARAVVIAVPGPGAVQAGLCAARFARARGARVVLVGDPGLLAGAPGSAVVPPEDPRALAEALGLRPPPPDAPPAFGELPLGAYLAPGLVLPFRGAGLAAFVEGPARSLGAAAVLCGGPPGAPEDLPAPGTGPVLGVTWGLGRQVSPELLRRARAAGVRRVRWVGGGRPGDLRTLLRTAREAGVWNHVVVGRHAPGGWELALDSSPNHVHSWARAVAGPPWCPDEAPPAEPVAYAGVRPLGGRPFWAHLGDPAYLLLHLARRDPREVRLWRWCPGPGRIHELGSRLRYAFVPPGELTGERFEEICRLVEAGGAVNPRWVRHNLRRAFLIAYAEEKGVVVADSSLKRPRPEYVERVREKTGIDISGFLERGYTSVRPEYRGLGIGTRLLEGLTSRAGGRPIYSIIREDDDATRTIAVRNRTVRVARFHSEVMGKDVGLWMPEDTARALGLAPGAPRRPGE